MKEKPVYNMVAAALCVGLGIVLPFLTMQAPVFGRMLLPMHLPILLCGFICSWKYAASAGFVTPLLRSLLFSMPPFFPTALAMAFELATYGTVAALCYSSIRKRVSELFSGGVNPSCGQVYTALIIAMAAGRLVYGAVSFVLMSMAGSAFSFQMWVAGAFTNAWPGIALQLIVIPPTVKVLSRRLEIR